MRLKIFFCTLLLLLANAALIFAQDPGEPCSGNDPDNANCPIDNWVVLLALVIIVIAVRHLNNKRKTAAVTL